MEGLSWQQQTWSGRALRLRVLWINCGTDPGAALRADLVVPVQVQVLVQVLVLVQVQVQVQVLVLVPVEIALFASTFWLWAESWLV